jgi:hypothetical protein
MPSMSRDAISSSSRSNKDGGASTGFLSKASSSLRRSPNQKHKSNASNPLPSLEQVFYEKQKSGPGEKHSTLPKRPDVYRTASAPLDVQTAKQSLREGKDPQSSVEPTMVAAAFANNQRKETPAALSKSAGALPTNGEYMHLAGNGGAPPLPPPPAPISGSQNPNVLYQHIHDMASKRISTLDYFRKA